VLGQVHFLGWDLESEELCVLLLGIDVIVLVVVEILNESVLSVLLDGFHKVFLNVVQGLPDIIPHPRYGRLHLL
jgi:hypothetical protein